MADLHAQNAGIYDAGSVLRTREIYCLLKKNKKQKNVVHFLNAERGIRYIGFLKKKFPNTKFVATFHKPPSLLQETITDVSALRKLDGAIAVGANQVEFLKQWLDLENVVYIPHGVDTEFFKPNLSLKQNSTLLFVGQHLRDFDTFNHTISILVDIIKDLKVKVVLHPAYISKIVSLPNIEILTRISDFELLKLYQEATALYLPMLDSTACNSILEAMACGVPIITSKIGGSATYLEGSTNVMVCKGDDKSFIRETIGLLSDNLRLTEIGKSSRDKALELDWLNVAKLVMAFYQTLHSTTKKDG